jgi:hypothetical protein
MTADAPMDARVSSGRTPHQTGQIDRAPRAFGHVVDQRPHRLQGGEDLPGDPLDRPHGVDRDQDAREAYPSTIGWVTS